VQSGHPTPQDEKENSSAGLSNGKEGGGGGDLEPASGRGVFLVAGKETDPTGQKSKNQPKNYGVEVLVS